LRPCTGAPWRDIPEKYGNWNLIHRRSWRWSALRRPGERTLSLSPKAIAESGLYNIDNATVRAHVSAAGGNGGFIGALLAAPGAGSPVKFIASVTPDDALSPFITRRAKRQKKQGYDKLIDLPGRAPDTLVADKAYDADAIRNDLKS
jgi:transposase